MRHKYTPSYRVILGPESLDRRVTVNSTSVLRLSLIQQVKSLTFHQTMDISFAKNWEQIALLAQYLDSGTVMPWYFFAATKNHPLPQDV
jgi:hypothetical protein